MLLKKVTITCNFVTCNEITYSTVDIVFRSTEIDRNAQGTQFVNLEWSSIDSEETKKSRRPKLLDCIYRIFFLKFAKQIL